MGSEYWHCLCVAKALSLIWRSWLSKYYFRALAMNNWPGNSIWNRVHSGSVAIDFWTQIWDAVWACSTWDKKRLCWNFQFDFLKKRRENLAGNYQGWKRMKNSQAKNLVPNWVITSWWHEDLLSTLNAAIIRSIRKQMKKRVKICEQF